MLDVIFWTLMLTVLYAGYREYRKYGFKKLLRRINDESKN